MNNNSIKIEPKDLPALLSRTKKFDFNRYYVDHPSVKGFLRIANIPVDILKIDESKMPLGVVIPEDAKYFIGYNAIVGFVNIGEKKTPTKRPTGNDILNSKKKVELMNYVVSDNTDEPWNEYVIQDKPPKLLRVRTMMTNAYWYPDYVTNIGDPYIHVSHNTSISVSNNTTPESGLV